ncbi:hypothetical protein C0993_007381, partial [Termitomyces sp. T159_Od127]
VAKESEADVQRRIANSLEALVWEGLGLEEAAGAGKGSRQGPREEKGTKKKMPKTTAGAAKGVAMPAAMNALIDGTKGLALPTKKLSPTKLSSKHRGHQVPRYERQVPTQQDFSDKKLARLLVPSVTNAGQITTQRGAGTLWAPPPLLPVHGHKEAMYPGRCEDT